MGPISMPIRARFARRFPASARRHDLDVWRYLGDILPRLADLKPGELERLLPDTWRREQEGSASSTADQPSHTAA